MGCEAVHGSRARDELDFPEPSLATLSSRMSDAYMKETQKFSSLTRDFFTLSVYFMV